MEVLHWRMSPYNVKLTDDEGKRFYPYTQTWEVYILITTGDSYDERDAWLYASVYLWTTRNMCCTDEQGHFLLWRERVTEDEVKQWVTEHFPEAQIERIELREDYEQNAGFVIGREAAERRYADTKKVG